MLFLWLLAGHFLGDFAFQSDWMAREKGKSWEVGGYHSLIHAATVLVVAKIGGFELSFPSLFWLLASHLLADSLKSRWKIVKTIWQDQILHIIILVIVFLLNQSP